MPEVGADRKLPASIWWIYFVLGAAILLPWNGTFYFFLVGIINSILQQLLLLCLTS